MIQSHHYRILLEQSGPGEHVRWFGEDGRLVALSDPVLKRPTRPPNIDESDVSLDPETFFCPPFFGVQSTNDDLSFGKIFGHSQNCQIDVSLRKVMFGRRRGSRMANVAHLVERQ